MELDQNTLDDLCRRVMITPSLDAFECLMILRDYWLEKGEIEDESADLVEGWQQSNAARIGDPAVVAMTMRREAERAELRAAWTLAVKRIAGRRP